MFAIFCFCFLHSSALASQWPVVLQSAEDAMPNIELGLAPPLHVWPQVAAEIGQLTDSRERMENANMDKLQQEFNKAEAEARRRIGNAIGRAMRVYDDPLLARSILIGRVAHASPTVFRQLPQDTLGPSALSVKVNVLPASPPDPSLRTKIDDIEFRRSDEEKELFDSAKGELKALLDFIVNEVEEQIRGHLHGMAATRRGNSPMFIQRGHKQLPTQANVRLVPTDLKYPTVASMVQDMEARRDIAENLERKRIIEKELDFVLVCNRAVEEGLKASVSRILALNNLVFSQSLKNAA